MNDLKEYTMNETKTYKKKLLFHLIFSVFYITLFIYILNYNGQSLIKTPVTIISFVFSFLHVMLTKKYIWFLQVFGYDDDEDEDEFYD
jgi:hypothetical protein